MEAVSASLEAPPVVGAGADIPVTWQGPDNRNDNIVIAAPGAADGDYINRTWANRGSPLTVRAPDEPGSYELRYVMGQSQRTLARLPLRVR